MKKEPTPPVMVNYCSKCGKELLVRAFDMRYDIKSGEKEASWHWFCPNKRFWNFHTSFRTDEDGSTYPYES